MKNYTAWILFFSMALVLIIISYFIFRKNSHEKIESFVKSKRNLVVLILGQSNAANYCEELNRSYKNIFMYYENGMLRAKDPILGASGKKGSIWIPVFEDLLERRKLDSILIVNIAQGSSSVLDWQANGIYDDLLRVTFVKLQKKNLEPDLILWQQGEQDNLNGMSKANYKSAFLKIHNGIKRFAGETSILISITSFHPKSITPVNSKIREAQCELIEENKSFYSGPDTDIHVENCRYDGIHFSAMGMKLVSKDWADSINDFLDMRMNSETKKASLF